MTFMANLPPTAELQEKDAAHHLHPFTDSADLNAKGARIISRPKACICGIRTATRCWMAWPGCGV